ncbi:efflux transporter outer membrane subunit [Paraburkholderia sediminicola]|uniref:efflux transporter outer membrane subunit n=1 Tax=Paraburkholderia sediminicola TaxID=458836 RepID=UPI0038BBFBE1
MRLLHNAVALAAGILVAGCSLAPDYVRPESAIPPTLPEGGIYPPGSTDARDISQVGWQDFFVDGRLRQVIQRGLVNNRDLRVAAANVVQAQAQYQAQHAERLPAIGTSGSATYANSPSAGATFGATNAITGTVGGDSVATGSRDYHAVSVGFSSFEIDLFGRVRNLSKAARERYLATEEAQRSLRISLIAEIATVWLRIASDEDQLALSQQTLDTFADTLKLTTAQFRLGIVSELESRQAETNYYAARNDIAQLRTRIAEDRNALNLLVGGSVEPALLPTALGDTRFTIEALPTDLSSTVLLRRPDVQQAEHELIAQNANIGAARAEFFPSISLTATLGTISPSLGSLFSGGSWAYAGSPAISLPLFDGGRLKGNLDAANASRDAAVATYQKTIQAAFREVADALAERGTIDERISVQKARASAAQAAAKLSDARYRSGVESFLTALDAQRTAYATEQQLATTRLDRIGNLIELYRSLGGGLN